MVKNARLIVLSVLILFWAVSCVRSAKETAKPEAAPEPSAPHRELTVAGSGSNIPLTQKLLDAWTGRGAAPVRIPPSIGTAGAVKALQAGRLDLGLISRPLKDAEKESGLTQRRYARIGIVLGVHSDVPDLSVTAQDLVDIYRGTKSTWSNGRTIIVLARESGDSSNMVLENTIPGFREVLEEALAQKRWDTYYTDREEFDAIVNTPNSLGLTDTTSIRNLSPEVKALSFAGIDPTLENVRSGEYPLFKDLYFAWREPLSETAKSFLEFVYSGAGKIVTERSGGIPMDNDAR